MRSPSFKAFRDAIGEEFRITDVPEFATSAELRARFEASEGRPPRGRELLDLVEAVYADFDSDPMTLVESMLRNHDKVAEMLNRFHMQVVRIDARLPGLVVGDTPVVHANEEREQYGFRDRLALGDANLIMGPLTRRTVALFTARPVPNTTVTTRRMLDAINAIFIRAASAEVACHPEDIVKVRQIHSRVDRLPPHLLKRGRA